MNQPTASERLCGPSHLDLGVVGFGDHQKPTRTQQGSRHFGHEAWWTEGTGCHPVRMTACRRPPDDLRILTRDLDPIGQLESTNGATEKIGPTGPTLDQQPRCLGVGVRQDQARQSGTRAKIHHMARELGGIRKTNKPHGVIAMGFAFVPKLSGSQAFLKHQFGISHLLIMPDE